MGRKSLYRPPKDNSQDSLGTSPLIPSPPEIWERDYSQDCIRIPKLGMLHVRPDKVIRRVMATWGYFGS